MIYRKCIQLDIIKLKKNKIFLFRNFKRKDILLYNEMYNRLGQMEENNEHLIDHFIPKLYIFYQLMYCCFMKGN